MCFCKLSPMRVVIAPKYQHLEDFLRSVAQGDYQREEVWRNRRNTVELVRVGDVPLVVKKYKRPTLANCLIYTFFRKNKAQKAWENAFLFQKLGLETATPVAYMVRKKWGFFHTAWFVSEYLPYPGIEDAYLACSTDVEKKELVEAFVDFTLHLHELGIVHRDYNRGNILVHRDAHGYHFALIDINRLWLKKNPGVRLSMRSLQMLNLDWMNLAGLLPRYAEGRHFSLDDCVFYLSRSKHQHTLQSHIKHGFKRFIGLE